MSTAKTQNTVAFRRIQKKDDHRHKRMGVLDSENAPAKLQFDTRTETFVGNDEANAANAYLRPAYRKHYRIPDDV